MAKIAQCCALFSAPEGRVYRPRDGERTKRARTYMCPFADAVTGECGLGCSRGEGRVKGRAQPAASKEANIWRHIRSNCKCVRDRHVPLPRVETDPLLGEQRKAVQRRETEV